MNSFEKNAGIALLLFTILMTFTMILHPAGGQFEYLLKIRRMIIITHTIALISLPFAAVGFWGLTKRLGTENFFSISAFSMILFGLIAVMIAASTNGLVLPVFISKYEGVPVEVIESLKPLLKYNFSVNNAYDYVYTIAFCFAILFWAIAILNTKRLPVWLAYLGIGISITAGLLFTTGIASGNLNGFRLFVSTLILWIFAAGYLLIRGKRPPSLA